MLQVTFPEIARTLEGLSSSVPAAESHGCLCGALCTASHYSLERWLDEIVPEEATGGEQASEDQAAGDGAVDDSAGTRDQDRSEQDCEPLRLLFADTLRALRGEEMEFELLLPDDDSALASRATALSQWCQGFLYGFGTGAAFKSAQLPGNVDEVLRDLTHIGRASVELGEPSEQEEAAYAEILEYVRVGVQLIHDELFAARAQEGRPIASGGGEAGYEGAGYQGAGYNGFESSGDPGELHGDLPGEHEPNEGGSPQAGASRKPPRPN